MTKIAITSLVVVLAAGAGRLAAKDPPQAPTKKPALPTEQQWLQQLVGEWSYEGEVIIDPGQAPVKSQGTESARALGKVWLVAETSGKTPTGDPMTAILTLGYDPEKKKYVGTWVCSVMSQLWTYEGALDESGKILTLETEGPNPTAPGKKAKYRDVIEIKGKDHRVHTSSVLASDGKWLRFVTVNYRRRQP